MRNDGNHLLGIRCPFHFAELRAEHRPLCGKVGPIYIDVNDAGQFTTEFLQIGLMHDIAQGAHAVLITVDN